MGFLSTLTHYKTSKWSETDRESLSSFDEEGFGDIESAVVTEKEQEWGMSYSICLMMKGDEMTFIPLSRDSELLDHIGEEVDPESIDIITLSRDGDDDIYRCDGEVKAAKKANTAKRKNK